MHVCGCTGSCSRRTASGGQGVLLNSQAGRQSARTCPCSVCAQRSRLHTPGPASVGQGTSRTGGAAAASAARPCVTGREAAASSAAVSAGPISVLLARATSMPPFLGSLTASFRAGAPSARPLSGGRSRRLQPASATPPAAASMAASTLGWMGCAGTFAAAAAAAVWGPATTLLQARCGRDHRLAGCLAACRLHARRPA